MRISTLMLILIGLASNLQAANRFWIATSPSNWNNEANWSVSSGGAGGASVPGSSDRAIFDGLSTGTCSLDMDTEVRGLDLRDDFSGIIIQTIHSLSIGNQNFLVSGGSFEGGSGQIDIDGNLIIDGGTLLATTDSLFCSGGFTITSGIFNHK